LDTIRSYLTNVKGFNTVSSDYYAYITEWDDWYKGFVKGFHTYSVFNGLQNVGCHRYSLGMASKICQDHANLLMNEKVQISTGSDVFDNTLTDTMTFNNFRVRANQLVEITYALGTGAFVEYQDAQGRTIIDYVRAQMIYPLAWDNGDITECAFASLRIINGEKYYYINTHRLNDIGNYVIENILVKDGDMSTSVPDGIAPMIDTKSPLSRFQIIQPNIVNNIDYDCPMGMSIYGDAIDELKAVDVAYDSYVNEFALGKKRIFVKNNMLGTKLNSNGEYVATFDPNDVMFYSMPDADGTDAIKEINMSIRATEHEAGLQRFLSLLGDKCGLGSGRYKFEQGQPQTATQVISEKSDMYQNLKKNELVLESAMIGMTKVIAEMNKINPDSLKIKVDFDDSIITDEDSARTRMLSLVTQGRYPLDKYLVKYENYDEKEAKKIAASGTEAPTVEDGFGSNAEPTAADGTIVQSKESVIK
jgi:A118 family predicted phage portal protein